MFLQVSVCPQGGCLVLRGAGGAWSWGVPGPEGVPGRGDAWSWGVHGWGVPGPGRGAWSGGGAGIPACTEADTPPTGMHSFLIQVYLFT